MPRPKGSKNKSKTITDVKKILPELGDPITESYVGFASPSSDLSNEDKANIIMLRGMQQYESLKRFLVMSARDFYRLAGTERDVYESRMNARIGLYIEDLINGIDKLSTLEEPPESTDAYDIDTAEQPESFPDDVISAQP